MTGDILAQLGWAGELEDGWPHAPRCRRGDLTAIRGWVDLDPLAELVATNCLPARNLSLIAAGDLVPRSRYTNDKGLLADAVEKHVAAGGTLSFRALERILPAMASVCAELDRLLGHPTQANAYLTPPGRQGFDHHWDPHVAIVVQVRGSKVWELDPPDVVDPVAPEFVFTGFSPDLAERLRSGSCALTVRLEPGDVLWVPRGWIHNPYSPDDATEPSLHITIGLLQRTRAWLLQQLLAGIVQDQRFREALPPRTDPAAQRGTCVQETVELAIEHLRGTSFATAAEYLDGTGVYRM